MDISEMNAYKSVQEGVVLFPALEDKDQGFIEKNDVFMFEENHQHSFEGEHTTSSKKKLQSNQIPYE
jgi:hypothetical protein